MWDWMVNSQGLSVDFVGPYKVRLDLHRHSNQKAHHLDRVRVMLQQLCLRSLHRLLAPKPLTPA